MKSDYTQDNQEFDTFGKAEKESLSKQLFDNLGSHIHGYISHKNLIQMHEHIEFDHPSYPSTIMDRILPYMAYFASVAYYCHDVQDGKSTERLRWSKFRLAIKINHQRVCDGNIDKVFSEELYEQLENARCCAIDFWVNTIVPIFHSNPDGDEWTEAIGENYIWEGRGLSDHLESKMHEEQFTYKAIFRYPNDDSHTEFAYICNGKSYAVKDLFKDDIVQKASDYQFYGDMITMHVSYDMAAHPEILPQLRDAVREYVPEELEDNLEEPWEENDEGGDPHYLGYILSSCNVDDKDLRRSQQFADRVNQILAPIASECTFDCVTPALDHCFYDKEKLAVASFVWKDQKLQIVGTIL